MQLCQYLATTTNKNNHICVQGEAVQQRKLIGYNQSDLNQSINDYSGKHYCSMECYMLMLNITGFAHAKYGST